jgi:hypothetical protein
MLLALLVVMVCGMTLLEQCINRSGVASSVPSAKVNNEVEMLRSQLKAAQQHIQSLSAAPSTAASRGNKRISLGLDSSSIKYYKWQWQSAVSYLSTDPQRTLVGMVVRAHGPQSITRTSDDPSGGPGAAIVIRMFPERGATGRATVMVKKQTVGKEFNDAAQVGGLVTRPAVADLDVLVEIVTATEAEAEEKAKSDKQQAITAGVGTDVDVNKEAPFVPMSKLQVPRRLHQIWISRSITSKKHALPKFVRVEADKMRETHQMMTPRWECYLWGDELWELYADDAFVKAYTRSQYSEKTVAFAADYFRLLVLRDYGGVFVDVDSVLYNRELGFELVMQQLLPSHQFFVGMRKLADNPGTVIEVAALGSAPHGAALEQALVEYESTNILSQEGKIVMLPQGGNIGRWLSRSFDASTVILNYKYFYEIESKANKETITLNTQNMGTWRLTMKEAFNNAWPGSSRADMISLLSSVQRLFDTMGFTHWMGGVALLGLVRNGSMLAWEQGVDIVLEEKNHTDFEKHVVPALQAQHISAVKFWGGWKLFPTSAKKIKSYKWGWPFIDVTSFEMGGDNSNGGVGGGTSGGMSVYKALQTTYHSAGPVPLPSSAIIPTQQIVFEGKVVRIPAHPHTIVQTLFGSTYMTQCKSREWDRSTEEPAQQMIQDCAELIKFPSFPFASHWVQWLHMHEGNKGQGHT